MAKMIPARLVYNETTGEWFANAEGGPIKLDAFDTNQFNVRHGDDVIVRAEGKRGMIVDDQTYSEGPNRIEGR